MKNGRNAMDYRCDSNSRIMAVKWIDNSMVNLTLNFVEAEPIGELERWCGKEKVRKKHFMPSNCSKIQQKHGTC